MDILLSILIILLIYLFYKKVNREKFQQQPIIWMYWENKNGYRKPKYLNLCYQTVIKHNKSNFKIIHLNEKNIYDYLPNLRKDLNQLLIPQKVDYIRIKLLHEYGGIWIDYDTIVMRNLMPIIQKLENYDFVGFGCTGHFCTNGNMRPSNGVMASRKGSLLMRYVLKDLDAKLNRKNIGYNYFSLGKHVIWRNLQYLKKTQNYDYYHYDSSYDGSRMKNKRWVKPQYYFNDNIELLDESKLFFIFLTNTDINNKKKQNRDFSNFLKMNKKELLQQNYWICKMFRKSLDS